jgi:hypothetical protein
LVALSACGFAFGIPCSEKVTSLRCSLPASSALHYIHPTTFIAGTSPLLSPSATAFTHRVLYLLLPSNIFMGFIDPTLASLTDACKVQVIHL